MRQNKKRGQAIGLFLLGVFVGVAACMLQPYAVSAGRQLYAMLRPDTTWQDSILPNVTQAEDVLTVDTLEQILVYYPHFSRIDLECGERPDMGDERVLMATEAAFTGKVLEGEPFKHSFIAGSHVSGGVYYKGYPCKVNTGAFVWKKGKWRFIQGRHELAFADAADNQGAGFAQVLFIHQGKRVHCSISTTQHFRALCERGGKLCVIQSRGKMRFFDFVLNLLANGVDEALYLDSGQGYVRYNNGNVISLNNNGHTWNTNWLVFYR